MTSISSEGFRSTWERRHQHALNAGDFSAAHTLANWLNPIISQGLLAELAPPLAAGNAQDFARALDQISAAQRETLQNLFGPSGLQELRTIAAETEPAMFFTQLLHFAHRREEDGKQDAAALIYQGVAQQANTPELQHEAGQALAALTGQGGGGLRFESMLRNIARETLEPTTFLAFAAGGLAFRGTRVLALGELLGSSLQNPFTRGLGAEALSYFLAFNAEALTFTGSNQLAGQLLGRPHSTWGRDLATNYLNLGVLRLVGSATGFAFNRFHGFDPLTGEIQNLSAWTRASQRLLPQAAMLGGLLLSHQLEARFGLRDPMDFSTNLTESLVMMFQFNAIHRLMPHVLGSDWLRMEQSLDLRARLLSERNSGSGPGSGTLGALKAFLSLQTGPRFATLGPELIEIPTQTESSISESEKIRPLWMASENDSGDGSGKDGKPDPRRATTAPAMPARKTLTGFGTSRLPAEPPILSPEASKENGRVSEVPPEPVPTAPPNDRTTRDTKPEVRRLPRDTKLDVSRLPTETDLRRHTTPGLGGARPPTDQPTSLPRTPARINDLKPLVLTDITPTGEGSGKPVRPDQSRVPTEPEIRRSTLGLGADVKAPVSPTAPKPGERSSSSSTMKAAPPVVTAPSLYLPGQPYRIEGIPVGSRLLRVGISQDPARNIVEAIEAELNRRPGSVLVIYEGEEIDPNGSLRIDLHRILGISSPEFMIAVAFLKQSFAYTYQVRAGTYQVTRRAFTDTSAPARRPVSSYPPAEAPRPVPGTFVARDKASSVPDVRSDTKTCANFNQLREALADFLTPQGDNYVHAPAIRLTTGILGFNELQRLAPTLSEHPMPEGHKIQLHWSGGSGGRVVLQRVGDRVVAELRTPRKSNEVFWYVPQHPTGGFDFFPMETVPTYGFEGWKLYENDAETQIEGLVKRTVGLMPSEGPGRAEEGSAMRAHELVRVVSHLLKANPRPVAAWPAESREALIEAHRWLEKSYTYLDFDTVAKFQERLGRERLLTYRKAIEDVDTTLRKRGSPGLVSLSALPTDLNSNYAIPVAESVRHRFLYQLFSASGEVRSPQETAAFMKDSFRMGQIWAVTFREQMAPLYARILRFPLGSRGETLKTILDPTRTNLPDDLVGLREEIVNPLADLGVYGDIIVEGVKDAEKRIFHRNFLRSVFFEKNSIRELYSHLFDEFKKLPSSTLTALRVNQVPSMDGINSFVNRRSSRP